VGHGRSSAKAVRNAITMASRFAAGSFVQRVQQEIAAASVSQDVR
jgi:fatty acid/phospholipid biosynthesis enzyme